jgi:AcrR family transcriptional regulator
MDSMKEQIIRKAADMFLSLGFKSVTMDDIAHNMGISKKTIYQHFENKPELVEAVTMHLYGVISTGIDEICSHDKNAVEELYEVKNFVMHHLKNESASPLYQLQKYFPTVFSCLRQKQFDKMQTCVVANLSKGIEMGLYRPDIDIDFIGRIYFVGMSGIKDGDIFPATRYRNDELTEKYLEYHLRGIVTPKGLKILENTILNN